MDQALPNPAQQQPHQKQIPRTIKIRDKKVHGKRYPPAVKLAIKSLQGSVSVDEAAALTGANRNTIVRAWEDPELEDLSPTVVSKVKIGMQGLFYKRGLQGLLSMTPEKYSEASLLQIATTVGIMTEKGRLMDGLSTDNISFKGVSQSIDEDRAKIMARFNGIADDKT